MNAVTIIISDGSRTAVISNGKLLTGARKISFVHNFPDSPEMELNMTMLGRPAEDVDPEFIDAARRQLGYEVASK